MNEARSKAWKTRRKVYGERGHNGNYRRPCAHCRRMTATLVALHVQGVLSEGQIAKATGLHRIDVRKLADDYRDSTVAETHCPACGYTPADCATHLDHHLCSRYPFFPNEIAREFSGSTDR